jgi:hypothetical protein
MGGTMERMVCTGSAKGFRTGISEYGYRKPLLEFNGHARLPPQRL